MKSFPNLWISSVRWMANWVLGSLKHISYNKMKIRCAFSTDHNTLEMLWTQCAPNVFNSGFILITQFIKQFQQLHLTNIVNCFAKVLYNAHELAYTSQNAFKFSANIKESITELKIHSWPSPAVINNTFEIFCVTLYSKS